MESNKRKLFEIQPKQPKGITLIALIITIIVMLILAGISINMLIGDNGVLKQGQNAKEKHAIETYKERIGISVVGAKANLIEEPQTFLETVRDELKPQTEFQGASFSIRDNDKNNSKRLIIITKEGYIFVVEMPNGIVKYLGKSETCSVTVEERKIYELARRIKALEESSVMKTITRTIESSNNIFVNSGQLSTILSIVMPEDGYVDVYGFFANQNNDSLEYKGIFIYINDVWAAGNGQGGKGGEVAGEVSCFLKLKKGDNVQLKALQYTGGSKKINNASLIVNYFPCNIEIQNENIDDVEISDLESRAVALENKTKVYSVLQSVKTINIATSTTSVPINKIVSLTVPENCYADVYGMYGMQNGDSLEYKGIHLYLNGVIIGGNGKGGSGETVQLDTSRVMQLKKGDILELGASQYTGAAKQVNRALIRLNYIKIDNIVDTEVNNENKIIEERLVQLEEKISIIEDKRNIRNINKNISSQDNVYCANGVATELFSQIVPEDCYADIYVACALQNNDIEYYKGICIYVNGVLYAQNGKGGKGGEVTSDVSCSLELKKDDNIIVYYSQYTGVSKKVNFATFRMNYLKK